MAKLKTFANLRTGKTSRDGNPKLANPCPRCGAPAQVTCRRWVGGRVCGQDIGGGYWRHLTNPHRERV